MLTIRVTFIAIHSTERQISSSFMTKNYSVQFFDVKGEVVKDN
jgi:hypothetical protein